MVSSLKNIDWLSFRRLPNVDAGKPDTSNQDQESSIQDPISRIQEPESRFQNPVSSIQYPARGFTLLEVMVSVAILSIVLVSVYKLHSQSLTLNTEARFYTQAPMLAQSKLSEMEANSESVFSSDFGDFGENFPGYAWKVEVEEIGIESLGEVSQDFKKIDVTVSYNENEFVYALRTYRIVRDE
jgi:general secretion pathway protein I